MFVSQQMRKLLSVQTWITHDEWCKERGIERGSDIIEYYAYLQLLSIPNHSITLTNDEVSSVMSWLPSYALSSAKCTCKQWSVINISPTRVTTFEQDAAYEMSWLHMSQVTYSEGTCTLMQVQAAKRGYALNFSTHRNLPVNDLCHYVSKYTDGSDRYYDIITLHLPSETDTGTLLKGCITRGDTRMFHYIWDTYTMHYKQRNKRDACLAAAGKGRIDYLTYILQTVTLDKESIVSAIGSAYCNGYCTEVAAFFESQYRVTYDEMITAIMTKSIYPSQSKSLGYLIFLLENSNYRNYQQVILYIRLIEYSLEDFIQLWHVMYALIKDSRSLLWVLQSLVVSERYDCVLYLRDACVIRRKDITLLYDGLSVYCKCSIIDWVRDNLVNV